MELRLEVDGTAGVGTGTVVVVDVPLLELGGVIMVVGGGATAGAPGAVTLMALGIVTVLLLYVTNAITKAATTMITTMIIVPQFALLLLSV